MTQSVINPIWSNKILVLKICVGNTLLPICSATHVSICTHVLSVCLCVVFFAVSSGSVTVTVDPKVEVLHGETAKLPCTYTVSTSSSNIVIEWFYSVSNFFRFFVFFFVQVF